MNMADKLTKAEIIESLYARTNLNRKDIHVVIDHLLEEVKTALTKDRVVELRGFGTFEVRVRKGRSKARNPRTGEIVAVNDHGVAVFRPGKELKKVVWSIHRNKPSEAAPKKK
jgi:nucleoid DNA-binding protein